MSEHQFDGFLDKNKNRLEYLNKKDRRMRFNNAQDPIYFVFSKIEDRPLLELLSDFINDLIRSFVKMFKSKKKK